MTRETSIVDTEQKELGMREGFDVGHGNVRATSQAFRDQMLQVMNYGGKVAILGILHRKSPILWT